MSCLVPRELWLPQVLPPPGDNPDPQVAAVMTNALDALPPVGDLQVFSTGLTEALRLQCTGNRRSNSSSDASRACVKVSPQQQRPTSDAPTAAAKICRPGNSARSFTHPSQAMVKTRLPPVLGMPADDHCTARDVRLSAGVAPVRRGYGNVTVQKTQQKPYMPALKGGQIQVNLTQKTQSQQIQAKQTQSHHPRLGSVSGGCGSAMECGAPASKPSYCLQIQANLTQKTQSQQIQAKQTQSHHPRLGSVSGGCGSAMECGAPASKPSYCFLRRDQREQKF
ncbi:uncharacterized protein LOC108681055 [Hyalella azteca]|uniref:Uncharacterized protein LOC108681055 n=1 Tax=Hyalella azteca TaxID=294128 RepID=A0A979FGM9_HYAAZ|nr:uncharacterized protein LOC108681055 [Hyalella azteca]